MIRIRTDKLSKYYGAQKEKLPLSAFLPFLRKDTEKASRSREVRARGVWALKDVSFEARAGETLGIIGSNGAGKSTLLKILARVSPPTSGSAHGVGRVVSLLELGTGFQPELSARSNIFLNAALYEVPARVVEERLDEIVAFAQVERFVDHPLKAFSSGMYLRLAFSVAVNLAPDILLADEVLAVGDLAFQDRCFERVQSLREAGGTTLFVSHDMSAVRRICDRVLWLHQGEIRGLGPTDEIISAYESYMFGADDIGPKFGGRVLAESEHVAIVAARLLSPEGEEIGALRVGNDALFEIVLQSKMPNTTLYCGFDVFAVVGTKQHVFRGVQPEFAAPHPGRYAVRVRIPARSFVDVPYLVNIAAVALHDGGEYPIVSRSAFGFRGYSAGDTAGAIPRFGDSRLKGLFSPELHWQVTAAATPQRASA